jgi:hypothetical protein
MFYNILSGRHVISENVPFPNIIETCAQQLVVKIVKSTVLSTFHMYVRTKIILDCKKENGRHPSNWCGIKKQHVLCDMIVGS